ncbi:MAG TPA: hypothetical protein VMB48_13220 [Steroidobacteraceae bacterium]|nr:hypothetical protein [Steroidobacteraceae bacterium]
MQASAATWSRHDCTARRRRAPATATHRAATAAALAALLVLEGCALPYPWRGVGPGTASVEAADRQHAGPAARAPPGAAEDPQQPGPGKADTGARPAVASQGPHPAARGGEQPRRASPGLREAIEPTDVGYYMDVLQGLLTQKLGREARIGRRGEDILIALPRGFDGGSAGLNASGRALLRPLAAILREYRLTAVAVEVRGADADAADARLCQERRRALARYLIEAGVAGRRIQMAQPEPARHSSTDAVPPGEARVELQVSPIVLTASSRL